MSNRAITGDVRSASIDELFSVESDMRSEINRRASQVLREIGYDWFRVLSLFATMIKRGKVEIIKIEASIEVSHSVIDVNVDIPIKQFEMLMDKKYEA